MSVATRTTPTREFKRASYGSDVREGGEKEEKKYDGRSANNNDFVVRERNAEGLDGVHCQLDLIFLSVLGLLATIPLGAARRRQFEYQR